MRSFLIGLFILVLVSLGARGCMQCMADGHGYWQCHDRGLLYSITN